MRSTPPARPASIWSPTSPGTDHPDTHLARRQRALALWGLALLAWLLLALWAAPDAHAHAQRTGAQGTAAQADGAQGLRSVAG